MRFPSFTALSQALGSRVTRRSGIAATLAGFAAALADNLADARVQIPPTCRSVGMQCAIGDECCSGRCIAKLDGTSRCARKTSNRKRKSHGKQRHHDNGPAPITCLPEQLICDRTCVDVSPIHCHSCEANCVAAGAYCEAYGCVCPSGFKIDQNGRCVCASNVAGGCPITLDTVGNYNLYIGWNSYFTIITEGDLQNCQFYTPSGVTLVNQSDQTWEFKMNNATGYNIGSSCSTSVYVNGLIFA